MSNFRKQIAADIAEYQDNFAFIEKIKNDDWAFNYWVLDKLFYEDNELIEEKIIDYKDMGIDAYEIYEDTKEIYLIQNKYYSDTTPLSSDYVKNDFLVRGITALENGTYKKSEDLQNAFSKYKNHPDFTVYLQLFVTNDLRNKDADAYINQYNVEHPQYHVQIFYLSDIEARYYGEISQTRKKLSVKIESVNKGTILNLNTDAYKLENVLDARYVLTPVVSIYRVYRDAIEKQYPIFDKNIREYLGNTGVNKNIYKTLLDREERKNFFYYNNGITVICDKMGKINTQQSAFNMNAEFMIENPQIVNGCQTVNSIYTALKNIDPAELEQEFKDTFVMLKILQIDNTSEVEKVLYRNIVTYNNSQNAIDEKTFVANNAEFNRLQTEFEKKGFLLLIKQSDKNQFANKYKTLSKLKDLSHERISRFGIKPAKKASDLFIPLEKFLQVINAFVSGGQVAYVKKSCMLKFGSEQYNTATAFIKNADVTIDTLLDLYLLYLRAEQDKKAQEDKRAPIPYYLIDAFAKYECVERTPSLISSMLDSANSIDSIIDLYTKVSKYYVKKYIKEYGIDYNKMIKRTVDYDIIAEGREFLIET